MRFPVDIHEFNSVRQRVLLQRSLLEEQGINEKANTKIIGVTLETRPDHINKFELRRLRRFAIFDTCTVFSIFIIEINLLNQAVSRPRDKDLDMLYLTIFIFQTLGMRVYKNLSLEGSFSVLSKPIVA